MFQAPYSRRLRCIKLGGLVKGRLPEERPCCLCSSAAAFQSRSSFYACAGTACKYGISYRDFAEMMQERGVAVAPSTIFRWVQRYAPEIERRIRPYQGHRSGSWRVDETYVRVGGKGKYLFRAVDKHGRLIAFMLSDRSNTNAAYRFLRKAIKAMSHYPPSSITSDKLASYPKAIRRLQNEGLLPKDVAHRTSK
jgi:IS6 family transposase